MELLRSNSVFLWGELQYSSTVIHMAVFTRGLMTSLVPAVYRKRSLLVLSGQGLSKHQQQQLLLLLLLLE